MDKTLKMLIAGGAFVAAGGLLMALGFLLGGFDISDYAQDIVLGNLRLVLKIGATLLDIAALVAGAPPVATPAATAWRSDSARSGGDRCAKVRKSLIAMSEKVVVDGFQKLKPNAPVQINHAILDDTIPYAVGEQLGSDWCDKGTRVTFNAGLTPTHVGGMVPHVEKSMWFFEDRFAGRNQASSCWRL